jgi:hypothetical protein
MTKNNTTMVYNYEIIFHTITPIELAKKWHEDILKSGHSIIIDIPNEGIPRVIIKTNNKEDLCYFNFFYYFKSLKTFEKADVTKLTINGKNIQFYRCGWCNDILNIGYTYKHHHFESLNALKKWCGHKGIPTPKGLKKKVLGYLKVKDEHYYVGLGY